MFSTVINRDINGKTYICTRRQAFAEHWRLTCQTLVSVLTNTGVCRDKRQCLTSQRPVSVKPDINVCYEQKNY